MTNGMISLFRAFRDGVSTQRRRALWRMLALFSVVKVIVFAAVAVVLWAVITHAVPGLLHTADETPGFLTSQVVLLAIMAQMLDFVAGATIAGPYVSAQAPPAFARTLLNAVAARDLAVGQITPITPEAPSADAASAAGEVGPLAHPMRALGHNASTYVLGIVGALLLIGLGVFMAVEWVQPSRYHATLTLGDWIGYLAVPCFLTLAGAGGLLWALIARHFARLERQTFSARVDDEGVTFQMARGAGGDQRLRWSEARAFMRMLTSDSRGHTHEVFTLSDGQRDLL
ncbi:MAG: hypothetical protein ACRDID_06210, partial [Ktedonobacterales bacterium]